MKPGRLCHQMAGQANPSGRKPRISPRSQSALEILFWLYAHRSARPQRLTTYERTLRMSNWNQQSFRFQPPPEIWAKSGVGLHTRLAQTQLLHTGPVRVPAAGRQSDGKNGNSFSLGRGLKYVRKERAFDYNIVEIRIEIYF